MYVHCPKTRWKLTVQNDKCGSYDVFTSAEFNVYLRDPVHVKMGTLHTAGTRQTTVAVCEIVNSDSQFRTT